MSSGFKRSSRFGIIGVFVAAAIRGRIGAPMPGTELNRGYEDVGKAMAERLAAC
jgi:hypothetical protein